MRSCRSSSSLARVVGGTCANLGIRGIAPACDVHLSIRSTLRCLSSLSNEEERFTEATAGFEERDADVFGLAFILAFGAAGDFGAHGLTVAEQGMTSTDMGLLFVAATFIGAGSAAASPHESRLSSSKLGQARTRSVRGVSVIEKSAARSSLSARGAGSPTCHLPDTGKGHRAPLRLD